MLAIESIKKGIAYLEVTLGLSLVGFSIYNMLYSTLYPESDLHGYYLAAAIFGAGIGGLMAFAGITLEYMDRWGFMGQVPLLIYLGVCFYIFPMHYS